MIKNILKLAATTLSLVVMCVGISYSGVYSGSGATTSSSGIVHPTVVSDEFAVGGTTSSAPLYFDGANLILNTAGSGVQVEPSATVGSGVVLSERSDAGAHTLTIKMDDTNFASDLTCTVDNAGSWSGAGCANIGVPNLVWGNLPVTELTSDTYLEIIDSNFIGTGSTDISISTVSGTIQSGENFTINTTGVYRIEYGIVASNYVYAGGDTSGCYELSWWVNVNDVLTKSFVTSSGMGSGSALISRHGNDWEDSWIGELSSGDTLSFYYDQCPLSNRLHFNPSTTVISNWYKIERIN